MHVKPKAGVLTRDPVKRDLLPEGGREVSDHDPYWLRRIADGDVIRTPTTATPARAKAAGADAKAVGTTRSEQA